MKRSREGISGTLHSTHFSHGGFARHRPCSSKGGLHAFQHGNATVQDRLNTPIKVRLARLGHMDETTTMGYTHLVGEGDGRLAKQLGELFAPSGKQTVLRANTCKSNKEALALEEEGLWIQ